VTVECEFLPPVPVAADTRRSVLAHRCHGAIRQKIV
jgi:hypothetical protein